MYRGNLSVNDVLLTKEGFLSSGTLMDLYDTPVSIASVDDRRLGIDLSSASKDRLGKHVDTFAILDFPLPLIRRSNNQVFHGIYKVGDLVHWMHLLAQRIEIGTVVDRSNKDLVLDLMNVLVAKGIGLFGTEHGFIYGQPLLSHYGRYTINLLLEPDEFAASYVGGAPLGEDSVELLYNLRLQDIKVMTDGRLLLYTETAI